MNLTESTYVQRDDDAVAARLAACVERTRPALLRAALHDALGGGGSRTRPRFCLAVARAAGQNGPMPRLAYACAAAVEMIHCASLAHDDLPCFDDAETRRGRPSLHRAHGQALAVLAGDALIVEAFRELASAGAPPACIAVLARAAGGSDGLVAGQAMELETTTDVSTYHAAKTGALFEAAAALGAESVGADAKPYAELGRRLGAFYQVADDVADAFGDARVLGKPVRRDAALGRPTKAGDGLGAAANKLREVADTVRGAVPANAGPQLRGFVDAVLARMLERALPGVLLVV